MWQMTVVALMWCMPLTLQYSIWLRRTYFLAHFIWRVHTFLWKKRKIDLISPIESKKFLPRWQQSYKVFNLPFYTTTSPREGSRKTEFMKLQEPHNKVLNISISSFLAILHRLDSQSKWRHTISCKANFKGHYLIANK